MPFKNQNIWIIGASSGMGRELAVQLDGLGANLFLSARSKDKLEELNNELGKRHKVCGLDASKAGEVKNTVEQILASHKRLDRVIFMSAIYKPDSIENMDIEFASNLVDVNLKSVFYLTNTVLPVFNEQQSGQIALCGSVAGYVGLANGQPYSATKAAIINFAESLYTESPKYIDVKLISPGFVETPMTDKNNFKMPMIISSKVAANKIIDGLDSKKFEISFPKAFTSLLKVLSILPYSLKLKLIKNFG
jgi:short-subunit dehydrogenase